MEIGYKCSGIGIDLLAPVPCSTPTRPRRTSSNQRSEEGMQHLTTSTPSTPASIAFFGSCKLQLTCINTLRCSPRLAMRRQSASLCGEAQGEVSYKYSMPKCVKRSGYLYLLLSTKVRPDKLFTFAQGRIDDGVTC